MSCFQEISPLKRFHFGGDEVPQNAYAASPACHEFVKRHEKLATSKDLKAYFVQRVTKILAKYNVSVIGWEDAYTMADGQQMPLPEMKTKDVMSQYYYNGWESGMAKRAYEYANFGYKVSCYLYNFLFNIDFNMKFGDKVFLKM